MDSFRAYYISGRSASWKDKLKLALLGLVGGAILIAAVILSLGLALVLIPLGFVAYLFRRPLLRALFRQAGVGTPGRRPGAERTAAGDGAAAGEASPPRGRPRTVIIDADYTVVEPDRDDRTTR